ncbi:MAG TPA: 5-(carboxyamino)imidazole ribonucleotide synthase, partial [Gemmatimonadales bacterium]|nr:5-(carboxyamino)imidazole ribonucleotide synthase [Gemmatimonadales bacterium]
PRPHNSGHWTQDAAATSQFEQQVRALCGLPLGDSHLLTPVTMVNILGDVWARGEPDWGAALADSGVKLHLYGKSQPRPGRKMGHLNVLGTDAAETLARAHRALKALARQSR